MKSWGWNLCCPKYKGQILRSYHGKIFDLHIQEILWPPYESNLENWNLIPSWILVVLSVGILHYLIRMKIVNTQCSIIIVAVVVLRWSAFTSSYLLSPNSCCQVLLCRSSDQCHSGCTLVTNRTQISIRNGRTSMLILKNRNAFRSMPL